MYLRFYNAFVGAVERNVRVSSLKFCRLVGEAGILANEFGLSGCTLSPVCARSNKKVMKDPYLSYCRCLNNP